MCAVHALLFLSLGKAPWDSIDFVIEAASLGLALVSCYPAVSSWANSPGEDTSFTDMVVCKKTF